ncbi:hypothetical protein FACS1894132_13290 [Clostridia bacterium]|nr:hypothetical protein FACS1894132_13290 [Clostridia bacterium]
MQKFKKMFNKTTAIFLSITFLITLSNFKINSVQNFNLNEDSSFNLVNSNIQISNDYNEWDYISNVPTSDFYRIENENGEPSVFVADTSSNFLAYATILGAFDDNYFLNVQEWLNQEYSTILSVEESGKIGWDTIYGLRRALQYEMGIIQVSDNFGNQTSAAYEKNILQKGSNNRLVAILQCALWCKGYAPGYNFTADIISGKIKIAREL